MSTFALIHSPLVGPSTWKLVAAHLERMHHQVIVPTLRDAETNAEPYFRGISFAFLSFNQQAVSDEELDRELMRAVTFSSSGPEHRAIHPQEN